MPDDQEKITLGYASSKNISFRGEIETDYSREEWKEMSEKERDEILTEAVWDLVDIWVKDE